MSRDGAAPALRKEPQGRDQATDAFVEAVEHARSRFRAAGVRWTATRERALQLLWQADGPIKPYDLISQFKVGEATTPPTIYRSLDALVAMGLAHRIPSLNAYVACRHAAGPHAPAFLICEACQAVQEIAAPAEAIVDAILDQSRFHPTAVIMEALGLCGRCRSRVAFLPQDKAAED